MALNPNLILNTISQAQNGIGNNSYLGQIRKAKAGMQALNGLTGVTPTDYAKYSKALNNAKIGAAFGAVASLGSGLAPVISNANQIGKLGDTSQQDAMINEMRNIGTDGYSNYDQLSSDYNRIGAIQPDLSWDTIRGGSTEDRLGKTATSTLSAAKAGYDIAGAGGAAVGALIGLGSSVGSWIAGNKAADYTQQIKKQSAATAEGIAQMNLRAGVDNLADRQFRKNYANRAAEGGHIERGQLKAADFASKLLDRQRISDKTHSAVIRTYCKGGTMIKIKR